MTPAASTQPRLALLPGGQEGELVSRCRQGDREAREELYRRTFPTCQALLHGLLGEDPDRADLLQEIYAQAFASLHSFRGDSNLKTWIRSIAVHTVSKHLRKRATIRRSQELLGAGHLTETSTDLASRLAARSALSRAQSVLETLRPEERIAFTLYYIQDIPLAEMAAITGVATSTLSDRVRRAKETILRALKGG